MARESSEECIGKGVLTYPLRKEWPKSRSLQNKIQESSPSKIKTPEECTRKGKVRESVTGRDNSIEEQVTTYCLQTVGSAEN